MATRRKSIEYWFPELAAVTDNTDTEFTAITAYIPETGSSFVSVYLEVMIQDAEITSNNVNRRQISLKIGSGAYTDVNNTNLLTSSSEQKWLMMSGDFTTLFTNAWTGTTTSASLTAKCLFDSAIATPSQNWRCATAKLIITYDYDDAFTTQIKTVRLPLITPISALGTTKPAAIDTIPAFDTWLPETGKTYRQVTIVAQGNDEIAATTDHSMSWCIDNEATYTTGIHEGALNTSCWTRHNQLQTTGSLWTGTSSTHSWYIWGSLAVFAHYQAWIVITYEFDTGSSTIMNSLLLPMEFDSPAGTATNADYQRASRTLFIAEPNPITIARSSIQFFWEQATAATGIQYRVNEGAWSGALTSTAATVAGSCGAQYICDSYITTLARGLNTFTVDIYNAESPGATAPNTPSDFLYNLCSLWMFNYTSGKHTGGCCMHNHTVQHNFQVIDTGVAEQMSITSNKSYTLPETSYFINGIGTEMKHQSNSTGGISGLVIQAERLTGATENGHKWESIYLDQSMTDALTGIRHSYSQCRDLFYRWPNDADTSRIDIATARRYRSAFSPALGWRQLTFLTTYHSITYTVSGTVSGSGGGTVNLYLRRSETSAYKPGDLLLSTSRSGDGSYSFTWYDDTLDVFVDAYEDSTHLGRSADGKAT